MFVLPLSRTVAHRAAVPRYGHSLDRFFDASFDRLLDGAAPAAATRTPALDVSESDSHYTLVLDVPGVTRDQLKVSVQGRRVALETIDASACAPATTEGDAAASTPTTRDLYRERSAARYARTVSLPTEVDQAASQAKFENGVLTLTLAKKVPTGATQITIS